MKILTIEELVKKLEEDKVHVFYGQQYIAVSLTGDLFKSIKRLLQNHGDALAAVNQRLIILSCAYSTGPEEAKVEAFLSGIEEFDGKLKAQKKQLAIIRAPANLSSQLQQRCEGRVQLFRTLPEAIKSLSSEYNPSGEIAEFQRGVVEVFKVQFGVALKILPIRRIEASEPVPVDQVVGLIPLVSATVTGNLILRFPNSTLEKLGEMTFGRVIQVPDPEVLQIAGELANMILGSSKQRLNMQGYGFSQTLPQMFCSTSSDPVNLKTSNPYWRADFESSIGNFSLEISVRHMGEGKEAGESPRAG